MLKLLLGIVKGAAIGGAVGGGAFALGLHGGLNWVVYGAVGALVGLLVGRPLWSMILDKQATSVVSVLKAIVGAAACCGLYALIVRLWGGTALSLAGQTRALPDWQPLVGAALGALYGGFVELDDAVGDGPRTAGGPGRAGAAGPRAAAKAGPRPGGRAR